MDDDEVSERGGIRFLVGRETSAFLPRDAVVSVDFLTGPRVFSVRIAGYSSAC